MNWDHKEISAQNDQAQPMQGMLCPNCGRTIQPTTSFCAHCRAAILRRYCAGCNRLVPDATKICPYCTTPATAKPRLHRFSPTSVGTGIAIAASLFLVIQGIRNTQVTQPVSSKGPVHAELTAEKMPSTARVAKPIAPQNPPSIENPTQLNIQGHELIKQKRYAEAAEVLRKAVNAFGHNSTAPAYPYAVFNLGQALRLSGNPKAAIPVMNACMNLIADPEMAKRELALDYQALSPQRHEELEGY